MVGDAGTFYTLLLSSLIVGYRLLLTLQCRDRDFVLIIEIEFRQRHRPQCGRYMRMRNGPYDFNEVTLLIVSAIERSLSKSNCNYSRVSFPHFYTS